METMQNTNDSLNFLLWASKAVNQEKAAFPTVSKTSTGLHNVATIATQILDNIGDDTTQYQPSPGTSGGAAATISPQVHRRPAKMAFANLLTTSNAGVLPDRIGSQVPPVLPNPALREGGTSGEDRVHAALATIFCGCLPTENRMSGNFTNSHLANDGTVCARKRGRAAGAEDTSDEGDDSKKHKADTDSGPQVTGPSQSSVQRSKAAEYTRKCRQRKVDHLKSLQASVQSLKDTNMQLSSWLRTLGIRTWFQSFSQPSKEWLDEKVRQWCEGEGRQKFEKCPASGENENLKKDPLFLKKLKNREYFRRATQRRKLEVEYLKAMSKKILDDNKRLWLLIRSNCPNSSQAGNIVSGVPSGLQLPAEMTVRCDISTPTGIQL